jgi:hypothetical protein
MAAKEGRRDTADMEGRSLTRKIPMRWRMEAAALEA